MGGTSGNGDGELDAGETCDLGVVLRNDGSAAASSVTGSAVTSDPYVTVVTGTLAAAIDRAGHQRGLHGADAPVARARRLRMVTRSNWC